MWKNASLAAKLIILIGTATACIFLAVLIYNYQSSKATLLREMQEKVRNLTLKTVFQIDAILNSVEKVPEGVATFLECNCPHNSSLEPYLKQMIRQNPNIYGMAAAFEPHSFDPKKYYYSPYVYQGPEGLQQTYLGGDGYHYFSWDWYLLPKEMKQALWSEPYYDEGGGNVIMTTYSVPVYRLSSNGAREFWGVVTADISLLWLEMIVAKVKILRSGYAFLISQNGDFITHPHENFIMQESIFSLAEARQDPELRRIGQAMIRREEGLVHITDFYTGEQSVLFYAPLPSNGWSLGVIFPENELFGELRVLSLNLALMGFSGLVFLMLLIVVISRKITHPLRTLATTTQAIGHGDFAVTVPETGPREIQHLSQAFNRLGRQLTEYIEKRDFIRDTFGRYVTQEVVKKLIESKDSLQLGGENRELSILMSDLRGFTAITATMDPQEVVVFLNRYLAKMIEILIDHRAVIDEIVGDGILAFFGAPEPLADHPEQAVACALRMQAAMVEINAANKADGFPHLEMGIAVNTGDVVVGNIGSERRTKYSIIGAQVNFTGRMESYTVGDQVLISPSTYAVVRDLVEVRDSFQVEMKGLPEPVTLYDICGMSGPYQITLPDTAHDLVLLSRPLPVRLNRIRDKIVIGVVAESWVSQISLTEALVEFRGGLREWEDVRLLLWDEKGQEIPGKIFGKVVSLNRRAHPNGQARIRFTSVSPEYYAFLYQFIT